MAAIDFALSHSLPGSDAFWRELQIKIAAGKWFTVGEDLPPSDLTFDCSASDDGLGVVVTVTGPASALCSTDND